MTAGQSLLLSSLVTGILTACGGNAPPVRVMGPATDIRAITGTWVGDYSSALTGRTGVVSFTLRADGDSAFGDVLMTPNGARGSLRPWQDPRQPSPVAPPHELSIRFVRVAGDHVSGSLTPYADPETGVRLFTSFEGRVVGDTISGTYTTRRTRDDENSPTGRWRVVRERP
jgi:hypothetical protein